MTEAERKARHRVSCKRYRDTHQAQERAYAQAYRLAHKKPRLPMPTAKVCAHCLVEKPREAFARRSRVTGQRPTRGALGVANVCNLCRSHLRKPTLRAEREERAQREAAGLKHCNVCDVVQPVIAFAKRVASVDGVCATCKQCANRRSTEWRSHHPGAHTAWYRDHRDERREKYKQWRAANHDRHKMNYRRWAKANPGRVQALGAKRKMMQLKATPPWADYEAIEAIYRAAAQLTEQTGIQYHVDHIVPIRHPLVCGLHVAWNLQPLTAIENQSKGNRLQEGHRSASFKPVVIEDLKAKTSSAADFTAGAGGSD